MRKINIYSTKGKSGSFETEETTWGAIKNQVADIVGGLDNLIATENINKTNLGHENSKLPDGNFTIFLRPEKTKSGVDVSIFFEMVFSELREFIKNENKEIKDILNKKAQLKNKNWTQLSTEELQQALSEYYKNSNNSVTVKITPKNENKDEDESENLKSTLKKMTRIELKEFIEEEEFDVAVKKSMSDEDIREAILKKYDEDEKEDISIIELEKEFLDLEKGFL